MDHESGLADYRALWGAVYSVGLFYRRTGLDPPRNCTLADIVGEWALFLVPLTFLGMKIFGAWVVDNFLALLFGIFFQYFTIAPMRDLSFGKGMVAAARADFFSLTAWQVGMYGWMVIATFVIFADTAVGALA